MLKIAEAISNLSELLQEAVEEEDVSEARDCIHKIRKQLLDLEGELSELLVSQDVDDDEEED